MVSIDGHSFGLHGGRSDTSKVFDDLFVLSLGATVPVWDHVALPQLPARYSHAMCSVGSLLVLHGGKDESHAVSHVLALVDLSSKEVLHPEVVGPAPGGRYFHSLVALGDDKVVCFGGMDASDRGLNDLYVLDLSDRKAPTWSKPEVTGDVPSPRWNATVWCKGGNLHVFGGCGENGQNTDMFVLDTKQWVWTATEPAGEIPPATQKYRQATSGSRIVCVGEKGPLRLYFMDLVKPKLRWESFKATGALPSLSSFALGESGGHLYLAGGKPFLGKDADLTLWTLDLSSFQTVAVAAAPVASPVVIMKEKEKHKYGTLRNMFKRKSVSEAKSVTDELLSAPAAVEFEASSPPAGVTPLNLSAATPLSPSGKTRKSSRASAAEVLTPKSSSGTLRRNDSVSRYAGDDTVSKGSSGVVLSARSPATSPGRTQKDVEADDTIGGESLIDRLRKELELERKKYAALREETDKVSGKGDASLLVRKALDEEVKRGAVLSLRAESLEKEVATMQQEKSMMAGQATRLKSIITDQGKTMAEQETRLQTQADALKEANSTISRLELKVGQTKALSKRAEDERVERTLAELKLRRNDNLVKEVMGLLSFVQGELHDLANVQAGLITDPAKRTQFSEKFLLSEQVLKLRVVSLSQHIVQSPALKVSVAEHGDPSFEGGTDQGSDSQDSESHSPRSGLSVSIPKLLLQTSSNPSSGMPSPSMNHNSSPKRPSSPKALSSPKTVASAAGGSSGAAAPTQADPEWTRHMAAVRDLEYRNSLEAPLSFPAPKHELVKELGVVMQRLRVRLGATQGDCRAMVELLCELETSFLDYLNLLHSRVCAPLEENGLMSAEAVFGNSSELREFQASFVGQLTKVAADPCALVALYSENAAAMLELHEVYAENLTLGMSRLEVMKARSARLQMFLLNLRAEHPRILDVRSLLIQPLVHLANLAESFQALAGTTHGTEDIMGLVGNATTVFRVLSVPVEMLHDKLALTYSNAKLRQLEMQLNCAGEDTVDLIGGTGRMVVDEGDFALLEAANDSREALAVTTVLCSDVLLFVKRAPVRSGRTLWLHEVFPLAALQVGTSESTTPTKTAEVVVFTSKTRPGVVYSLYTTTAAQARYWEEVLRSMSEAASALEEEKQGKQSELNDSGWLAAPGDVPLPPAALVDSDDIVYTKDTATGRTTVRGGKTEALVRWLLRDISGPTATDEILQFFQAATLCGSAVIPAEVIIDTSVECFKTAVNRTQQYRVLYVLMLWVREFGSRDIVDAVPCSSPVFLKFFRFVQKVSRQVELVDRVNPIKLGLLRAAEEVRARKVDAKVPKLDLETADLEEIPPGLFAEQLTYFVHGLLAALTDEDLYQGDKAPRVSSMIQFWNELSEWCAAYIGQQTDDVSTSWRLRRLLAIGKRCMELNNYDSSFAIGLALDSSRISRTAVENVGGRGQEIIDSLNFITNVSRGFVNYRTLTESLEPPAVPYLAIVLKDVVLIRENDNFIEKTQLVNYRKLVILGARLRFLRRFKRVAYPGIAPVGPVQGALRSLPAVTQMMKTRSPANVPVLSLAAQAQIDKGTLSTRGRKKSMFGTGSVMTSPSQTSKSDRTKTFTARSSGKRGVLASDDEPSRRAQPPGTAVVVLPPDPLPLLSPTAVPSAAAAEESLSAMTMSRWSRALPRASGVSTALGRQRSGDLGLVSGVGVVEQLPRIESALDDDMSSAVEDQPLELVSEFVAPSEHRSEQPSDVTSEQPSELSSPTVSSSPPPRASSATLAAVVAKGEHSSGDEEEEEEVTESDTTDSGTSKSGTIGQLSK